MTSLGTIVFTGASGKRYNFTAYSLDTGFTAMGAVYFITKHTVDNGEVLHDSIYIGETGNLSKRLDAHHKATLFEPYEANCICVNRIATQQDRLTVKKDLLANYDTACND